MSTFIKRLREECGYDPEEDGSIDDLIAYKDALEDMLGNAEGQLQAELRTARYRVHLAPGTRGIDTKIDTLKMALAILHGNLREVSA